MALVEPTGSGRKLLTNLPGNCLLFSNLRPDPILNPFIHHFLKVEPMGSGRKWLTNSPGNCLLFTIYGLTPFGKRPDPIWKKCWPANWGYGER